MNSGMPCSAGQRDDPKKTHSTMKSMIKRYFEKRASAVREPTKRVATRFPDFDGHWKRLRELGLVRPPASENERINRIIAGGE